MSEYSTRIALPNDSDGFAAFECPQCNVRFKLSSSEVMEMDYEDLFCPSCGISSARARFATKELLEAARIKAMNLAQDVMRDAFKNLAKTFPHDSSVKWNSNFQPKYKSDKIMFEADDLEEIQLTCCDKYVKVNVLDKAIGIYCPYCGER